MIITSVDGLRKLNSKRIDKLFDPKRPVILVFKEKHTDIKFVCLHRDELEYICLATLWERYHLGYYCDFADSYTPILPPIPKNDIDTMPNGITKKAAITEWKHYEKELIYQKETKNILRLVKVALTDRDGIIAFAILQDCSSGEYEGFKAEPSQRIENLPQIDLFDIKPE